MPPSRRFPRVHRERGRRICLSGIGVGILRKMRRKLDTKPQLLNADPADFRLFLAVSETGTITAGASRVHLSLTAASERLQRLEDGLGVKLLDRSKQGVRPTQAGRVFERHGRALMLQMDRLRADIAPYARGLRGSIRLLCNTAALTEFLPEALGDFLARRPDIDVDIEEMWSHQIVLALREGRAELGIVADSVPITGLVGRPFRHDQLVLVSRRGHALNQRRRVDFADMLDYSFIGLAADSALHQFLNDKAAHEGRAIHYRVRLRSFDAVCRLAGQGVGLAVVPRGAALRFVRGTQAVIRELADPWANRQLLICTRPEAELPSFVNELIDALSDGQAPN
jgi:DNA-binding transcriptional LysR family regulator